MRLIDADALYFAKRYAKADPDSDKMIPVRAVDKSVIDAATVYVCPEHNRWIPVTEELPKLIPCSAGTGYSEAVNVLTSGRKVITAIWDGTYWIGPFEYWEAWGDEITHWMPLPQLPKEVPENETI